MESFLLKQFVLEFEYNFHPFWIHNFDTCFLIVLAKTFILFRIIAGKKNTCYHLIWMRIILNLIAINYAFVFFVF